MQSFQYYKLRAGGVGIIAGLAIVWGAVVGLVAALADKQWGLVPGFALWGAIVAVIYGSPLGRWISREVNSFVATIMLLVMLVLPYFVLVWPARKLASSRGWIVELDDAEG